MAEGKFIVRPAAEVAIKSRRTRQRFERILRRNLASALGRVGVAADMNQKYGGLWLNTNLDAAEAVLPRVFGIGSWSRIEEECASDLDVIVAAGAVRFSERVRGRSYAVRARRFAPTSFSSQEVNEALGAALNAHASVDLSHPEITVHAHIGARSCQLFANYREGAGGLPVGSTGRAVVLLSGGFDSAVAAWRMLRRGVAVDYVFCNLGGRAYERMVVHVAKVLLENWGAGYPARLWSVDFNRVVAELRCAVDMPLWQVVLKRLMYQAASSVGHHLGASAIVTGESIGQVSSQTLSNIRSIDPAADLPVLRPLVGFDKQEIIDAARHVGTAPISQRVKEYCAIVPERPATSSRVAHVKREEAKMDPQILHRAIGNAHQIDLTVIQSADLTTSYLYTGIIPQGAVVIDCQPPNQFVDWHFPGAENCDPIDLLDNLRRLDKNRTYVVVCQHGGNALGVAEMLQQSGFEAYAFEGGINALKSYADEQLT